MALRKYPSKSFFLFLLCSYIFLFFSLTGVFQPPPAQALGSPSQNRVLLSQNETPRTYSPESKESAQNITFVSFIKEFYLYLSRITFWASFLMVVLGIYIYMTSGGDAGKIKKSREYLTNAVIGLVAVALAYTFFEIINPEILNITK